MAEVKLTSDGRLVNAETGEEFGRNENGRIVIDSLGSEGKTLEETGVREPDETEEEYYEAMAMAGLPTGKTEYDGEDSVSKKPKENDGSGNGKDNGADSGTPVGSRTAIVSGDNRKRDADTRRDRPAASRPVNSARQPSRPSHLDSGPSSFDAKRTKYEVTPDTFFIVRFGLASRDDGGFYAINASAAKDNPGAEEHWVKFRMWTYEEELKWKAECMEFNSQSKSQYINNGKLNEVKIKELLLDWSFGQHEDRLKLLHCDGRLSDESYSIFCGLYPVIANSIVDLMNSVLENT